jgi:Lipase maturation factor
LTGRPNKSTIVMTRFKLFRHREADGTVDHFLLFCLVDANCYAFLLRRPLWNSPHQPRLDWQMWFAALGTPSENPWFSRFLERLLENSPEVTALLGSNPFPHKPPLYVRALLYDYRYSSRQEKEATGAWWVRKLEGIYYPATALRS